MTAEKPKSAAEKRVANIATDYAKTALLFSLALFLITAYGIQFLKVDVDVRSYFSGENPYRLAFERLENTFGRVDNAIIAIESRSGDMFTRENLASLELATELAWQTPYSTRIDSLTNFQHSRSEDGTLIVAPLVHRATHRSDAQLQHIAATALSEPSVVDRLITADRRMAAIHISLAYPDGEASPDAGVTAYVRQLSTQLEASNADLKTYLTGLAVTNNASLEITAEDFATLIPAMYAVIIALLFAFLRSVVAIFAMVMVTVLSTASALGVVGWLGIEMHQFSLSSVNVLITLAIITSIHLLLSFLRYFTCRQEKRLALARAITLNLQPVFLTSLTTAIGFLSMNFSELPPTRTLGNVVAIGMLFIFIYSMIFLPALLNVAPLQPHADVGSIDRMMGLFAAVVTRHARLVFLVSFLAALFLAGLAAQNVVNDRFHQTIDESHQFRQDNDYIDERLGGLYTIELSIGSGAPDGIFEPAYIEALSAYTTWLREQEEIIHVDSYSDTILKINRNMHDEQAEHYAPPRTRGEAAQYFLLYEMSLPLGYDLGKQVSHDRSTTKLTLTIPSCDSNTLLALQRRIVDKQRAILPQRMQDHGTSMVLMYAHIGKTALLSALEGALLALLIISLLLLAVFRSVRIGVISLLPNLLPIAAGFGLWALLRGEIGMYHSGVLGIALGIVVDDSIHFVSKYLRARQQLGMGPEQSLRYSFEEAGSAIVVTSIVLVAGFGLLGSSDYAYNMDTGILTGMIILAALILDCTLLPALLLLFDRSERQT